VTPHINTKVDLNAYQFGLLSLTQTKGVALKTNRIIAIVDLLS
jgi:hypothetical protein